MKKVILFLLIPFIISYAQISISVGGNVSENFNSIGTSATATMPVNWKVDKNASAVRTVGTYGAAVTATNYYAGNTMSSQAGNGIYNFGLGEAASATDRAIGGLSSGSATKSMDVFAYFQNGGTSVIRRLDVSYDVFKFRNGSNTAGFTFQLYYSTDGTTWTSAGSGFTSSFTADADNSGGTVPLDTKHIINQTITNLNISVGGSFYLAWNYSVTSGATTSNAQALGIDNFVMNNISDQIGDTKPAAPVASAATNITPVSFSANWATSVGATSYLLDVSTSSSFGTFVSDFNSKNVGNVTNYSVTGLTQKTTYYYRLKAANSAGSSDSYSSTINVKTDSLVTKVQFTGIANAVTKSAGVYELTLSITNPSPTAATTCVVSINNDSSYTSIAGITGFTSAVVTFPAGSSADQKATVNLINNGVSERSRKAYFTVHNVSGGMNAASTTGTQPYYWLTIMSGKDEAYYSSINTTLTGEAMKLALYNLIKGHIKYPYTDNSSPTAIDVWKIDKDADEDPTNPAYVIGIYSGLPIIKSNQGLWNREHVYSKSHGNFGTDIGAGTDAHHLRAENANVNSLKNNLDFDNGGSLAAGTTNCYYDSDSWEPRPEIKGDIARMIFYMATRYRGENLEPKLGLKDSVNTMLYCSDGIGYYGKLSTLLQWNLQDPVDAYEINRNNIIYYYQHNRNPFIDHPEWVTAIWGGPPVTAPSAPAIAAASNISVSGFTANWSASATATGYYLDLATDNGFNSFVSTYNGKDIGNVTSYAVTGLTAGTNYYYRLRAYNSGGTSSNSNTSSLITVPAAPVAINATVLSNSSFAANWASSTGASGYYLDVATDAGFNSLLSGFNGKSVGNVVTYAVTGINYNTNYYYRVRASNAGGQSANSNTVTAYVTVGIHSNQIPDNYYLFQNYPNPFNPSTIIKFSLKKNSMVKILLYDIAGRNVETITNNQYSTGTHIIRFDASHLANGIYFYRIVTDEFSDIKKMVLMK